MSTDNKFVPRNLTASEYVRELFGPADNVAILVRNRSTGHTVQTIAKAEAIVSPGFQSWLANQNAAGSDIYVGMNPIKDGAYSRTKENIKDIRHVYLDLDNKGDEALETLRNSPEVPAPNFVLDTSPGKHQVVWKVSGFGQDEAESLARQESNPVYTLRDFTIDEDSPEAPRHFGEAQERRRTLPNDHESQSEHDWAYAKRALSRGDDPEVVIQRIADFRSNDKSDPVYYARLTVNKAQAQLAAGTSPEKPNEHGGAPENGPEKVPHH